MSREAHVRFWESPGVKFPRATQLPLERQVRVMNRQGLVVDSQTLWDQINALARHLQPAHEALRAYVLEQSCIGSDETFWRLIEGNGENKRWQTWAVVTPHAVSYRILDSRSAAAAADVLGDYSGTLLCDGYSASESVKKRGGRFEIAHCWAGLMSGESSSKPPKSRRGQPTKLSTSSAGSTRPRRHAVRMTAEPGSVQTAHATSSGGYRSGR